MAGLRRWVAGALPPRIRVPIEAVMRIGEDELRLLPALMDTPGPLIDVGANAGAYTRAARRLRRPVHAFEPHPEMARLLRRIRGDIHVHEVALADFSGVGTLHIPTAGGADLTTRSTLNGDVDSAPTHREVKVRVATLDSFAIRTAALLKIDVEGHEVAVLRGAAMTLNYCRCPLIVEVEESRLSGVLDAVASLLHGHHYDGFWCQRGRVHDIDDFDPLRHQAAEARPEHGERKSPDYINNFLWFPSERPSLVRRVLCALQSVR